MNGYNKVYRYIRRQGKEYARANYFRPEVVRKDFDLWNEMTGREVVYVEPHRMERYIHHIMRHYLVTEPRYQEFKIKHKLSNSKFAKLLGYANRISFMTTPLRWMRIEQYIDIYEEKYANV